MKVFSMGRQKGFTIVELVVTAAILGILLAIAVPTYRDHVAKSRRADATGVLMEASQYMERIFSESARYDQNAAGAAVVLPPALTTAPRSLAGSAAYYNISFVAAPTAAAYSLQAVPVNTMVSDPCGTLTLNSLGVKGVSGGTMTTTQCWR